MSATRDLQDDMLDAQDQLTALSRWLDDANDHRPAMEATLLRFLKVGEENGEMIAEIIGMTGQNPRKGVTSDIDKVIDEALDVVITALGAVEHATGNQCLAFTRLFQKIDRVHSRAFGTPGPIASDVKIDKFLDKEPEPYRRDPVLEPDTSVGPPEHEGPPLDSRTGHRHDDTDPWSKDGYGKPTAYIDGCLIQPNASPPKGFDPDCRKCDLGGHVCPGCGKDLPHGQADCGQHA